MDAHRWAVCLGASMTLLAACGPAQEAGKNPSVSLEGDTAVPAGPVGRTSQALAAYSGHQVVYLNFGGGLIHHGAWADNNAQTNTSFIPAVDVLVPAFIPGPFGADLASVENAVLARLNALYADDDVTFTLTRPGSGAYTMMMVGGLPTLVGAAAPTIGLSPIDPQNENQSDVGFVFSELIASYGFTTTELANVVAHEFGHTFGLRHISPTTDIMNATVCYNCNAGWGSGSITDGTGGTQDDRQVISASFPDPNYSGCPSYAVGGAIGDEYKAVGGPSGVLGCATGNEAQTTCGGGEYNNFQYGAITWSPSAGAHLTRGAIRAKWASLGYECSFLGFPTTDEEPTSCGGGRYNNFENGAIIWSAATGAHETHGGIRAEWAKLGYECGFLGFPTSDEESTACGGGRYNNFQNGAITWSAAAGAHATHGGIRAKWGSLGYECSALGFPTSEEYSWNGGVRQDFQNGHYIFWNGSSAIVY